jgi:hypothetical protein
MSELSEVEREPTAEESRAICSLKRLAKRWPDTLYLASMGGSLNVMRKDADGGHAIRTDDVDLDQSYSLATIAIDNTGGDW